MSMPKRWYDHDDVKREFGYHPATEVTGPVHDAVRQAMSAVAHRMVELLPEGPRKTQALNLLLQAMWAANSAVACQADPIWQEEVVQLAPYPRLVLELNPEMAATAIFEALGTASVCWLRTDEDGIVQEMGPRAMGPLVFDSGTAAGVGRSLASRLGIVLPASYQDTSADMPKALVESGPKAYPWAQEGAVADETLNKLKRPGEDGTEGAMPVPPAGSGIGCFPPVE